MGISTGEKDDGIDKSNHSDSTTTTTPSTTTTYIGKDNTDTTSQNQHHHQQYEQNENSKMMKVNSEEIGQKEGESVEADLDVKSRAKRSTTIPVTTTTTDTNTLVPVSHSGESLANRTTNSDDQSIQIDSSGILQIADDQNQNLSIKVKKNSSKIQSSKKSSSSSSCQSFFDESQPQQVLFPQVDNKSSTDTVYTCCPYTCRFCTTSNNVHGLEDSRENNEIQLKDSESIIIVKSQIEESTINTCTCSNTSRQNDGNLEILHPVNYTESNESVCRICHDNPSKFELMSPCLCKGSMGRVHRHCLERWLGESGKSTCEICGYQYITIRRPKYTGFSSFCAWIRHPTTPNDMRNFFFDLACFFILTPLAGISAWLCVVGAQHYSFGSSSSSNMNINAIPHRQNRIQGQGLDQVEGLQIGAAEPYDAYAMDKGGGRHNNNNRRMNRNKLESSNSAWTSIGLLTLTGTLLAAYYIWLFVAIRYHIQVWREWQMRNFLITIVPVSDENLCQCHNQQDQNQNTSNNNNNNNNTQQNRQSSSSENYSGRSTTGTGTSSGGESEKSTASTSTSASAANGSNNNDSSSNTTRTTNIYEGSTPDGLKINISGTLSGLKINVSKVENKNVSKIDDSSDSSEPSQNQKLRKIHGVQGKSSESSTCSCSCLDQDGRKRCRNRNMKISLTSLITNRNSGSKVHPEFTVLQMPTEASTTTNKNEGTSKNVNININGAISASTRPTQTNTKSSRENHTTSNHHEKESLEGDLNDNTDTDKRDSH